MPIVKIENELRSQLRLTQNERRWQLIGMTGLNPPPANIVTSVIPGFDGSRFNSSRLESRNVVITLALKGNVEFSRMLLNAVVMPKRYLKIYYKNNTLDVYIEGYVDTFEYDIFEQGVTAQISIICTDPYWAEKEETKTHISSIIGLFEFPFSIPKEGIAMSEMLSNASKEVINSGAVQTGVMITIECNHKVINPSVINATTRQIMKLNTELYDGDQIVINTVQGNKYIRKYSDGEIINVINSLDESSQWISVLPGVNTFLTLADYGTSGMTVTVSMQNRYGGV